MSNGLYLPDGTFQPFQAAALSSEIGTRQNAGVTLGELEGWLNVLPDPDPVLRKRGEDAAVLAELSADDQVTTAMLSRKNRVLNCPDFTLRAGAPDGQEATPEADELYRRFARDLERCNLRQIISAILDAPFYGFVPLELVWRRGEDWWHLVDIVARPPRWFAFDNANNPVFVGGHTGGIACGWRGNRFAPEGAMTSEPVPLPPGKFVLVTHHATYDNPYGLRLLSRCLWPVAFKRGGLTFYARFVERHGLPWVIGEAPAQAERQEKAIMARDLSRMVQDAVAVIPHGAKVELQTAGQTQSALHEDYLARQDKAISKILMGQTLTAEMEGTNSLAAAETHKSVADDLADTDKAMVVDAWNEIAWLYAQVNAGPGVLAPLAAYEEPDDLNIRADLDKKLTEIGVVFTAEHFKENYGLKDTEFTVAAQPAPESASPASFAAPGEAVAVGEQASRTDSDSNRKAVQAVTAQNDLEKAITGLLPRALKSSDTFVTELENAIKKATSFDDLEHILVEYLAPSMQPDALEDLLAVAMTAAAGHGAAAVQAEADADA